MKSCHLVWHDTSCVMYNFPKGGGLNYDINARVHRTKTLALRGILLWLRQENLSCIDIEIDVEVAVDVSLND